MTRRKRNEVKGDKPASAVRKSTRQTAKKQLEGQLVNGEDAPNCESKSMAKNAVRKGVRGRRKKVEEPMIQASPILEEKIELCCDNSQDEISSIELRLDESKNEGSPSEQYIEETIVCEVMEVDEVKQEPVEPLKLSEDESEKRAMPLQAENEKLKGVEVKTKKAVAKLREFSLFDGDEFKTVDKVVKKKPKQPVGVENTQVVTQVEEKMIVSEPELLPIKKMESLDLSDFAVKKEDSELTRPCQEVKIEKLQLEEGSRDSEVEVKVEFDDVKICSSSENSNDTLVSISSTKVSDSNSDSKSSMTNDTSEAGNVRRSSRIRSIGLMNKRSHGRGLVSKPLPESPKTSTTQVERPPTAPATPTEFTEPSESLSENGTPKAPPPVDCRTPPIPSGYDSDSAKPVKVKSRWRRSSELEMGHSSAVSNARTNLFACNSIPPPIPEVRAFESVGDAENSVQEQRQVGEGENALVGGVESLKVENVPVAAISTPTIYSTTVGQEAIGSKIALPTVNETDREMEERLSQFEHLKENLYLTERYTNKEHKKMVCDCFLTDEEFERGELGCGEDCLNRLLMIECGPRCNIGTRCTNKRFQNCEYAKCEVFRTEKKGFGLRATCDLEPGGFVMEYVGEVVDPKDFRRRAKEYSKDQNKHYYFMALKSDQIIDATMKGNVSRFINHSCEPNAETQKWTVNGELRIGFFNKKFIAAGEEITFDYHFQRYGKEAQRCFCEASACRGWIGDNPKKKQLLESEDDEEDEEEEEEEDEEEEEEEEQKADLSEMQTDEEKLIKETKEKARKVEKKARRKTVSRRKKKEEKKPPDHMEDEDLEEEIDKLCAGGLKNRTHTLTLSRLMVRSREIEHRTRLLRVIRNGEQPCRRLFLDYSGLKLIWSYMMDVSDKSVANSEQFRLEILKTLKSLPIPNKTMLMDSKVYNLVEKWATKMYVSPNQSPEDEQSKQKTEEVEPKLENNCDSGEKVSLEKEKEEGDDKEKEKEKEKEPEVKEESFLAEIMELAESLLADWANLKEVFRIPKKERIEQMKEHEREADRGYREELEKEERRKTVSYDRHRSSDRHHRSESDKRSDRRRGRDSPDFERPKDKRGEERTNLVPVRKMTKYERRQLFALRVAKEEEEKQRRQQQELWKEHEARCHVLGIDPHTTAVVDQNTGYPLYFNQSLGQWQPYPMQENTEIAPPCAYIPGTPAVIPVHASLTPNAHPLPQPTHPVLPQTTIPSLSQVPHADLSSIPPPASLYLNPAYTAPPSTYSYPDIPNNIVQIHNGTPQSIYEAPAAETQFQEENAMSCAPSVEIPPMLDLPPKWKWAKDARGRTYYYHVKERISQWLPPPPDHIGIQPDSSSSEESSEESSLSEEEEDVEEEVEEEKTVDQEEMDLETTLSDGISMAKTRKLDAIENEVIVPSSKKRREGLVQERIISPRREENRVDHRKYKEYKEKLKQRQKEKARLKEQLEKSKDPLDKSRKHRRSSKSLSHSRHLVVQGVVVKPELTVNDERKIKETFKTNLAPVMVSILRPYTKEECQHARITSTQDFKHLARKLTNYVMTKELKHCKSVDELQCNENVKRKAKDYVRKVMKRYGPVYQTSPEQD